MIYHSLAFVLCDQQEIDTLAQKIVRACTIPDDKKSLRLLRRFWKAISLEVPKKLPQMVCSKTRVLLCWLRSQCLFSLYWFDRLCAQCLHVFYLIILLRLGRVGVTWTSGNCFVWFVFGDAIWCVKLCRLHVVLVEANICGVCQLFLWSTARARVLRNFRI